MNTKLPTTPGAYWWKEKDGDEWEERLVDNVFGELRYLHVECDWETCWVPLSEHDQGQWAKAHKPDDGQEAFAVRCPNGQFTYISTEDDCDKQCEYLNETDMFLDGQEYNVVPVTIYRKEKE